MAHSQVEILYPDLYQLPILEFRATDNRYFALSMPRKSSGDSVLLELMQYGYQPETGFLNIFRPITVEERMVEGYKKDVWGKWRYGKTFKRWRQVEFRELDLGELLAVEREMGNVSTMKRKWEAKRCLQRFRDENYQRPLEDGTLVFTGLQTEPMMLDFQHRSKPTSVISSVPWHGG